MLMAACLVGAAAPASAQTAAEMDGTLDTLFGSHQPYQDFLHALKQAVAADDRAGVAGMVDYPFKTRIDGKAATIRDAAHFVASYDKIVTAKIKQAVAAQSYPTLFANWRGVMIGNGEIWFSGIGDEGRIAIIAINH
ncbi:hypothetical protein GCM10017653_26220 [Ancylobacter defluvii]|uniref:Nuclear transport factor 2 family protein n=1 Tax=Ancylobacter defluvii TaxID=1282440 RepID=A0A9W6NBF1_9HYPH|nr:hypothetical protein GCM10017653_26220 [Ancylobacter defluvii]